MLIVVVLVIVVVVVANQEVRQSPKSRMPAAVAMPVVGQLFFLPWWSLLTGDK